MVQRMATPDTSNLPALSDTALPLPLSPPHLGGDKGGGRSGERALAPVSPRGLEPADLEGTQAPAATIASPLNLSSLLKAFRHRWLLALSAGLTMLALFAAAAWYLRPAKYTAYALLRVSASEPQPLIPDQRAVSASTERYFENTQIALIKSRPIILAALRRPGIAELAIIRSQDDPAVWLEDNLKAAFLEKTDILRVSLDGAEPKELPVLVNAVKDAYMEEEVNAQRNKKLALLDDLEKVYLSSDEKIRHQRAALRDLAQRLKSSDVQALGIKQKAILDEYASLRKELSLLQAQVRGAEIALSVHKTNGDRANVPAAPDAFLEQAVEADLSVARKKVELEQLDSQIAQMAALTEPGHPTRDRLEKERKRLEESLEQVRARLRSSLRKQLQERVQGEQQLKDQEARENLEVWRRQEALLQSEVDRILKEAQSIGVTTFELEQKRNELEQAEAVIRKLREEKERLQVELQSSKQRVSVLHAAEVPTKKNVMEQARIVGFAGVLGLLLGLFGICYWEARSHRIRSKEEVVDTLGCPVVGVLPWVKGLSQRRQGAAEDPVAVLTASVADVRAQLLCEAEDQGGGRVLMVTSAVAREGKTTLASHLAVSVAQAGRRTLLIDGDFHRPQLHHVFDLARGPGLCEVLRGGTTVKAAAQQGCVPDLFVLTVGEAGQAAGSSQIMGSMRTLLEEARREFDFIVLDSSPVLPVADALLLGKRSDGVLMSVRPNHSQLPLVSEAFERLALLRIPMLGVVVNGARSRRGGYYGYVQEPELQSPDR
jgi:succinoglycan biosynthesis transport protein ExoP